MKNKEFYKTLLRLAIPVALQNLLSTCANIVDTAMVTGLGNAQVAAVGVAGRWVYLVNVMIFGLGSGVATQLSQYWGAGEKDNMRRTQSTALVACLGIGAAFAIAALFFPEQLIRLFNKEPAVVAAGAEYIRIIGVFMIFSNLASVCSTAYRSTENVKLPMYIAGAAVVVNTALNYVLIHGHLGAPALGVKGAAIATGMSLLLQGAVYIFLGFKNNHFSIRCMSAIRQVDRPFLKKFMGVSLPACINEGLWGAGVLICAAVFARQGSENYAAYTIFNSLESIAFIFFQGLAAAIAVLVGKNVGNGRIKTAYKMASRVMVITPIMGIVVGLMLIALRDPLLMLFDIETEAARQTVRTLLLIYGFWFGVRMINYTGICGIIRAGGDASFGVYMDMLGLYACAIPAVLITTYVLKAPFVVSVAAMIIVDDSAKAPLVIRHIRSRKWIKKLTQSGYCSEEEEEC